MSEYIINHSGIKGQKWGIRRYQNPDGSLTAAGINRYSHGEVNRNKKRRVLNDPATMRKDKYWEKDGHIYQSLQVEDAAIESLGGNFKKGIEAASDKQYVTKLTKALNQSASKYGTNSSGTKQLHYTEESVRKALIDDEWNDAYTIVDKEV